MNSDYAISTLDPRTHLKQVHVGGGRFDEQGKGGLVYAANKLCV